MKLSLTLITLILLLAVSAVAQLPGKPFTFSVAGGISAPTGQLNDIWKAGYHGSGRIAHSFAPKLEFTAGLDYHSFPRDALGISGLEGGDYKVLMLAVDVRLNLGVYPMPWKPFLFGGGGIARATTSDMTYPDVFGSGTITEEGDSNTKPFIEIGGGVSFGLFFIQGKFVNIFYDEGNVKYVPFSVGIRI